MSFFAFLSFSYSEAKGKMKKLSLAKDERYCFFFSDDSTLEQAGGIGQVGTWEKRTGERKGKKSSKFCVLIQCHH